MNKNIDLKKLEELSCLHLPEDKEDSMLKSIQGVVDMLNEIEQVNVNSNQENFNNPTNLAEDQVNDNFSFEKSKPNLSVNIQDGFFLAPKVIK